MNEQEIDAVAQKLYEAQWVAFSPVGFGRVSWSATHGEASPVKR